MKAAIPRPAVVYALLIAVMAALAALPLANIEIYWILILFLFFVYLAMTNMWNLVAGYSGLISLGQPAFIGLAGYSLGVVTLYGLSPFLGIVAGGLLAAAFAVVVSVPTFRMKGIYFAIGTWIVAEALRIFFNAWRPAEAAAATWGGAGISIKAAAGISIVQIYYLALTVGFGSIFLMRIILKSKLGLELMAIRDNEATASSSGVDVFRCKLYSFVIGAFVTGIAAGVFYLFQGHIEPISGFGVNWTIILVTAVIIGGIGTIEGPIAGTAIAVLLQQLLARYVGVSLIIQGIILVAIISLTPRGIVGTIQRSRASRSPLLLAIRRTK